MSDTDSAKFYSLAEERLNILSHALGLALSVVGLVLLLIRSISHGDATQVVTSTIFGISMIMLYAASTAYHSAESVEVRTKLRIVDHAAIYILIAGTYTPFSLLALGGRTGWLILIASWTMAAIGITLKLFFTGRFKLLSTLMYVFMGWLIVFAIEPLVANFDAGGLRWMIAGGISYTVGAIIYSIKSIPFNHAIFHGFVLGGTVCHFMAVYLYLLS